MSSRRRSAAVASASSRAAAPPSAAPPGPQGGAGTQAQGANQAGGGAAPPPPAPGSSGGGGSLDSLLKAASSFAVVSEDAPSSLTCPVCFDLFREASMVPCGHTFCRGCIEAALIVNTVCPKCGFAIEMPAHIFPNLAMNELANKARMAREETDADVAAAKRRRKIGGGGADIDVTDFSSLVDVDALITKLTRRKKQLETETEFGQTFLLKDFLVRLKKSKEEELTKLKRETDVISKDLESVNEGITKSLTESQKCEGPDDRGSSLSRLRSVYEEDFGAQRSRMDSHFDDLVTCYRDKRARHLQFPDNPAEEVEPHAAAAVPPVPVEAEGKKDLDSFAQCLSRFTRYHSVATLATLGYTSDLFSNASIVSSIEFDRDSSFFAIAGVTRRIKVYHYRTVLRDAVDIHYPSLEMSCSAKISCVAWNAFRSSSLASSDYDGTVTLWDTEIAKRTRVFLEHEKRCWSVDFNVVDTKLLASGSDDARVKLWSTNVPHSVASLEAKANVCCVKFSPSSSYHLAYGSADHCVHYYDLRNTKSPLALFRGHRKAVSYVKFLDSSTIVSASTDSQLKLWDLNDQASNCVRSFHGHINEKNFVGLATDGDYVTCGSENNALYVYYKGFSSPLFSFRFDTGASGNSFGKLGSPLQGSEDGAAGYGHGAAGAAAAAGHPPTTAAGAEFVSAVCWRSGTDVIVGANSQGTIKILKLE